MDGRDGTGSWNWLTTRAPLGSANNQYVHNRDRWHIKKDLVFDCYNYKGVRSGLCLCLKGIGLCVWVQAVIAFAFASVKCFQREMRWSEGASDVVLPPWSDVGPPSTDVVESSLDWSSLTGGKVLLHLATICFACVDGGAGDHIAMVNICCHQKIGGHTCLSKFWGWCWGWVKMSFEHCYSPPPPSGFAFNMLTADWLTRN